MNINGAILIALATAPLIMGSLLGAVRHTMPKAAKAAINGIHIRLETKNDNYLSRVAKSSLKTGPTAL
jgi:hypothetical protein